MAHLRPTPTTLQTRNLISINLDLQLICDFNRNSAFSLTITGSICIYFTTSGEIVSRSCSGAYPVICQPPGAAGSVATPVKYTELYAHLDKLE